MAGLLSDRVREAFERLDQAIDRLDAGLGPERGAHAPADHTTIERAFARKLDQMIARIEGALDGQ